MNLKQVMFSICGTQPKNTLEYNLVWEGQKLTNIALNIKKFAFQKITRRIRRTSRSRSPSPSRGRSRSRSPSRRKSLNRSPSPHRYNTRTNMNSEVSTEETESTTTSGKYCHLIHVLKMRQITEELS